jgi:two-component system CheB/CheR fusion protein
MFTLRQSQLNNHISQLRLPSAFNELAALMGETSICQDRVERTVECFERIHRLAVSPGHDKTGELSTYVVTLVDITDVAKVKEQLERSQSRLAALMSNTTVIFAMKDMSGQYLFANNQFIDYFNIQADDYVGRTDFALLPRDLATHLWTLDVEALRTQSSTEGEFAWETRNQRRILRSHHQVIYDAGGAPNAFIVEAEDITYRRQAEEQLRIAARLYEQATDAIVVTDVTGKIQTVNEAFTRATGYSSADVVGQPISILNSGRHSKEFFELMWQTLNTFGSWQCEIYNRRKDGQIRLDWLTINRVDNDRQEPEHFVAVYADATPVPGIQKNVEYYSTHDPLTGLPNRDLFQDRLRHALAQARRRNTRVALLFIDVDDFKKINDTLGHDIGDALLHDLGVRLREVTRDVDTVARLGGDEFTAIITDCSSDSVADIALRMTGVLSDSFDVQGHTLFVTASIGVAIYPDDGGDAASLIKASDSAMYRAKELGRNRVEFFKSEMHVKLLRRAAIERSLRESIGGQGLRLVYQPKYKLGNGKAIVGAEALLRWRHPELGDVSPSEFIPIAESSGLILPLGHKTQELLFDRMRSWREVGLKPPHIAFNVSPRSLRESDYSARLIESLSDRGLEAKDVQVEITEGALLENSGAVQSNLSALSEAGVGIAVDDFGTGYASMGYLKRLPISELKIDRSFVAGLGSQRDDEAIARAILALTAALEIRSVAEGIESDAQMKWLIDHGCDVGQGYLFCHPLESDDFEDLLAKKARHA